MPPGDGFAVGAAGLVTHAAHVDGLAAGVTSTREAAAATRPGPGAYGRLCTIVPALLSELQGMIVGGVGTAEHSLQETAGRLRTVARRYEAVDRRAAAALRRAGGSV